MTATTPVHPVRQDDDGPRLTFLQRLRAAVAAQPAALVASFIAHRRHWRDVGVWTTAVFTLTAVSASASAFGVVPLAVAWVVTVVVIGPVLWVDGSPGPRWYPPRVAAVSRSVGLIVLIVLDGAVVLFLAVAGGLMALGISAACVGGMVALGVFAVDAADVIAREVTR